MTPYDFYRITESFLESLAKEKGIQNIHRYYELTDFSAGSVLNEFSGTAQVFAQMAFHAQNATMISNIVRFERNIEFLSRALCSFNPESFLKTYECDDRNTSVDIIVEALRCGLKWDSSKSREKNKDSIANRYANTLLDCANFVNEFSDKEAFLNNLISHYQNNDYIRLIKYFRSKVTHGFSVALTCDFLKEFDLVFNDLPKPDVHIKDTLCTLLGHEDRYYEREKKEYECIADMRRITSDINKALPQNKQITVYKLDRMIWLICSGKFFLDNTSDAKSKYLQAISN